MADRNNALAIPGHDPWSEVSVEQQVPFVGAPAAGVGSPQRREIVRVRSDQLRGGPKGHIWVKHVAGAGAGCEPDRGTECVLEQYPPSARLAAVACLSPPPAVRR